MASSCDWSCGSWRSASGGAGHPGPETVDEPDDTVDGDMEQRVEHKLKEWIGAAEVTLLERGDEATAERFAWLAAGLLRRSPDKLWDLLREASREDLDKVPGIEGLLERLAQALIAVGRLGEASDLAKASTRWQVRLGGSVHRQLAQAQLRAGEPARAGETVRELLKRDASDVEAVRLLYRLLREGGPLAETGGRPVRIAMLSSYVIDPLVPFLDVECRRAGLTPAFYTGPFNQYTQEALNPGSGLYAFAPEIVIVVLELATTGRSPHGILDNRRADGLAGWVEDVNRDLAQELAGQAHTFLLPLREVVRRAGEPAQGRKLWYMARMRHGDATLNELARASMRYIKPLKGLTRKCVVVDLDNTLWGGVVGEVGADGIHLGPTAPGIEFVELQEALLNLTKRGILLAICSKNNPDDVLPVLREHKHMALREERFSAMRVNWRNKAENLAEIAVELNIGLDALVFLDDNPAERELVRQLLPEVLTVEMPKDASQYRATLEELTDFEMLAVTREDELRGSQYQANP